MENSERIILLNLGFRPKGTHQHKDYLWSRSNKGGSSPKERTNMAIAITFVAFL
jgi:hypothetical protein